MKEKVLEVMKEMGKPVGPADVAKHTGLEKSEVDKAFKELKAENLITSPVRCKWEPVAD